MRDDKRWREGVSKHGWWQFRRTHCQVNHIVQRVLKPAKERGTWGRGGIAGLVAASVMAAGGGAAEPPTTGSDQGEITKQQQAVMKHLRELYERDGREMPSLRIADAPNTYIPPGKTIQRVAADDDADGGFFSFLDTDFHPFSTERQDSDDDRSFFGGRTPWNREQTSSTGNKPSSEKPGFFKRLMTPFRRDQPSDAETRTEDANGPAHLDQSPLGRGPAKARSEAGGMVPLPPTPRSASSSRRMATSEKSVNPSGTTSKQGTSARHDPFAAVLGSTTPPPIAAAPPARPARENATRLARRGNSSRTDATQVTAERFSSGPGRTAPPDARTVTIARKFAQRNGLAGMQGYCPVALREQHRLVDARPEYRCIYRGQVYHVSSARAKALFDADPARYAPAAGGRDLVLEAEKGRAVSGQLAHGVLYEGRLYLFRRAATARQFQAHPERYLGAP